MVDSIWAKINKAYDDLDEPTHLILNPYDYEDIKNELMVNYGENVTDRDIEEEFGIKIIVGDYFSSFRLFKEIV